MEEPRETTADVEASTPGRFAAAGPQWPGRVPQVASAPGLDARQTPIMSPDQPYGAASSDELSPGARSPSSDPPVSVLVSSAYGPGDLGPADAGVAAVALLRAGVDAVCGLDPTALSSTGLVAVLAGLEEQTRRLPSARHVLVGEVTARDVASEHGCRSVSVFLRNLLRLSPGEAKAWVSAAEALAPRRALSTGQVLPAALPATAAAQAAGDISPEHVRIIAATLRRVPPALGPVVVADAERSLVAYAGEFDPKLFTRIAERLLDCLDPDGTGERHRDAKRLREVSIGRPGLDGLSKISGWLTPLVREAFLSVLETLSAPDPLHPANIATATATNNDDGDGDKAAERGEANPADDSDGSGGHDRQHGAAGDPDPGDRDPGGRAGGERSDSEQADSEQTDGSSGPDPGAGERADGVRGRAGQARRLPPGSPLRDMRSAGQRMHDALGEVCQRLLASGTLPAQSGLPATMLLIADLSDLEHRTGLVTTAHGGHVCIEDALRIAVRAKIIPAVYDSTGEPLWLGRARRTASLVQRLALVGRDGGCTFPGCDIGAWRTQAHHDPPWVPARPGNQPGRTDIDTMALICGYEHHRCDDWHMQVHDGRVWWTPPPWIDPTATPRTNTYFRPLPPDARPPPVPPD